MMPRLTDEAKIEQLREKVATMTETGTPSQIAAALNAREVVGHETGTIAADDARICHTEDTLLALADAAADTAHEYAAEANYWLDALAHMESIDLAAGNRPRTTLDALAEANVIPAAERDALIAAAQVEVLGESWGQQAGIGQIEATWVQEVRE